MEKYGPQFQDNLRLLFCARQHPTDSQYSPVHALSLSLSQIGTISIKRHISHHNNNDYNLAPFLSLLAVYY